MTVLICTDTAGQYKKVDRLIPGVIHKTTNHSKGEFVAKDDKSNTINPLENENKHFKRSLISSFQEIACIIHGTSLLQESTAGSYRQIKLRSSGMAVHPGCLRPGLQLLQIDKITPEDMDIEHLMQNPYENYDSDVSELSDSEDDEWKDDQNDIDWEDSVGEKPAKKRKR
ncbi:hypothetical protein CDAR_312561 [Caerostris darwini]|uniref:Uncharacterized protein n=1 Tax=Caerostris darwini TaxID=1538125 RepID=A0AAV4MCC1_9ARAC|nr:hypothetical protein CDAR_312561 [Caerostris darwini]